MFSKCPHLPEIRWFAIRSGIFSHFSYFFKNFFILNFKNFTVQKLRNWNSWRTQKINISLKAENSIKFFILQLSKIFNWSRNIHVMWFLISVWFNCQFVPIQIKWKYCKNIRFSWCEMFYQFLSIWIIPRFYRWQHCTD